MASLTVPLGVTLIAVAGADIFTTVLHYEHRGLLTPRLHRAVWLVVRGVARRLRGGLRTYVLSLGAPLMMVSALVAWMVLLVIGFALIYLPALGSGALAAAPAGTPPVVSAVYFSAVTLSTLGLGDMTPRSWPYQLVAGIQALAGLGLATMTISYVLNVYRVLQRINTLAGALEQQLPASGHATDVLAAHFVDGHPRELSTRLHDLYRDLLAYSEGLHHYPLVFYFHSGRRFRSLPYAYTVIGQLVAALRWGLPTGHPATTDPWLVSLTDCALHLAAYVEHHFTDAPPAPSPSVTAAVFRRQVTADGGADDPAVAAFVRLTHRMAALAGVEDHDTDAQRYARYVGWSAFVQRAAGFVDVTARALAADTGASGPASAWSVVRTTPSPGEVGAPRP